jgi:oxygen-independent coproporphyrinogen-3 oxidase
VSNNLHTIEHLYIHVPFCAEKCQYCAFYSKPDSIQKMSDYVDAALTELNQFSNRLRPVTIFFGGGTPSLLPVPLMAKLLDGLRWQLDLSRAAEWSIECNPATVTTEKAKLMREAGVNRISLGVQSFDDAMLKTLGRIHTGQQVEDAYRRLRGAGFDNINLDFIFGLPGQTREHWRETLQRAISMQPEHLSTYCLILEEDTPFFAQARQGNLHTDDDTESAMYEAGIAQLEAAGYRQYEISNFSIPGRTCAHNIAYWEGRDYIGIGPSACSTVANRRWQNVSDTDRYVAAIRQQQSAVGFEEQLDERTRVAERVAFGMRMNDGVPRAVLCGRWEKEIETLLRDGLVEWHADRLRPTQRGILFADEIAAEFV